MLLRVPLISLLLIQLLGCAAAEQPPAGPVNPSFPVTEERARDIIREEASHPKPLPRPLVIVGGFRDPGLAPPILKNEVAKWTRDGDKIVTVQLAFTYDFDQCRQRIVDAVQQAFPSDDPRQTVEVDVIGFSMGGLAARYAAAELPPDQKPSRRLRIARLFTISSPLRGAVVADEIPFTLHPLQDLMRPGSPFIRSLNSAPESASEIYEIYSYVRLGDPYISTTEAAVPGQAAWWLAPPAMSSPHEMAFQDPRILADILRRIYNEPPLTTDPPAPPPTERQN
jgi:pimeloyl-ACP methyl ester carboxylesterase